MSGPPKAPSHLHLVRGNPSKRSSPSIPKKTEKWEPQAPRYLSKLGRYWFQQWASPLAEQGLLDKNDAKALEMLVDAYVDYRSIQEVLKENGAKQEVTTIHGDVRVKPSAFLSECREARKEVKGWLQEFGMTPASRAKVPLNEPEPVDPLSEFLNSRED